MPEGGDENGNLGGGGPCVGRDELEERSVQWCVAFGSQSPISYGQKQPLLAIFGKYNQTWQFYRPVEQHCRFVAELVAELDAAVLDVAELEPPVEVAAPS